MTIVIGRIVDEDADRPERLTDLGDGGLEGRNVGDVAANEESADRIGQRLALVFEDVDEADFRALCGEGADDIGADAGGAAGDEDDPAGKAGVNGEGGNFSGL